MNVTTSQISHTVTTNGSTTATPARNELRSHVSG